MPYADTRFCALYLCLPSSQSRANCGGSRRRQSDAPFLSDVRFSRPYSSSSGRLTPDRPRPISSASRLCRRLAASAETAELRYNSTAAATTRPAKCRPCKTGAVSVHTAARGRRRGRPSAWNLRIKPSKGGSVSGAAAEVSFLAVNPAGSGRSKPPPLWRSGRRGPPARRTHRLTDTRTHAGTG